MRALALLLAASGSAFAATPAETMDAFQRALAEGRREQVLAMLDAQVRIFESGHAELSRDEYAAHHLEADSDFLRTTRSTVLRQAEQRSGTLAVLMRETETTGRYRNADVHQFGTETAVLQQDGDGWRIVHLHWSTRKPKAQ